MRLVFRFFATCTLAWLIMPLIHLSTADAATLQIGGSGGSIVTTPQIDTLATGQTTLTQTLSSSAPASFVSAFGEVDALTGTLKGRVESSGGGGGSTTVYLAETFAVTGSGTLTAFLDVSGTYNLFHPSGSDTGFQIISRVAIGTTPFAGHGFSIGPASINLQLNGPNSPDSGVVDEQLSGGKFITSGTTQVTVIALLLAQILGETGGVVDIAFANLFLETSPGLTLTPVDPAYLSNPAFGVTPVPLPAALPLLMSTLGFFGFMGWRRKRGATRSTDMKLQH